MLRNYIKIAWRNLWKNKIYNGLNIIGLSIGLCSVLFALVFYVYERSFDNFHEEAKDIYRVTTSRIETASEAHKISGGTGQVQGPAFLAEVPEIDSYVRVLGGDIMNEVRVGENTLNLRTLFVDDNFTSFFNFPMIEGDKSSALKDLNSLVLSEDAAMRLFGRKNVVGELVYLDSEPSAKRLGGKPLVVRAVANNAPDNSSIQFDILLPFRFLQLSFDDKNWLNSYLGTFVKISSNAESETVIPKLNAVFAKHAQEQLNENDFDPKNSYGLQPLTDIHLNSFLSENSWHEGGTLRESKASYSNSFLALALFIFLLAIFNFININISGSLQRIKEIGVRKVAGSSVSDIYIQFLCETILLTFFAISLALVFLIGLMPQFVSLSGINVPYSEWINLNTALLLLAVLLITSLLAGVYPAKYFSKVTSIQSLFRKNKSPKVQRFGHALLVLQFGIAFVLSVFSIAYYTQMNFISTKDLGFDAENIIKAEIKGNREREPIKQFLKNELAAYPQVISVSFGGSFGYDLQSTTVEDKKVGVVYRSIDENFLNVMNLNLKQGRNISSGMSHEILVNEAFLKSSQLEQPVGKQILLANNIVDSHEYYTIVGVIKNYHFESLRVRIKPQILAYIPRHSGEMLIKTASLTGFLDTFKDIYKQAMPLAAFEYEFISEKNKIDYAREVRWQKIISIATLLAIVICGMGIFGLSHLMASSRIREIGIRKVLGAKISEITVLLSKGFLKLVVIAIIIASPIAYILVNTWMQDFAYRIDFMWWILPVVALVTIAITLFTVSFQAIKAAIVNPVESLKSE